MNKELIKIYIKPARQGYSVVVNFEETEDPNSADTRFVANGSKVSVIIDKEVPNVFDLQNDVTVWQDGK